MAHSDGLRVRARRALAAATLLVAAPIGWTQQEAGLRWTHGDDTNWWVSDAISLGNHGQTAITSYGDATGGGETLLFSSFDSDPPTPMGLSNTQENRSDHHTASADLADVHAAFFFKEEASGKRPTLRKFGPGGGGPDWTYAFPFTVNQPRGVGVDVAADGQRLVAWLYDSSQWKTQVAVFDAHSATPVRYMAVDTVAYALQGSLSQDGRRLALASRYNTTVVDLDSGAVVDQFGNSDAGAATHGISADGVVVLRVEDGDQVDVHRLQGTSYGLLGRYDVPEPWLVSQAALAPDGRTLVLVLVDVSAGSDLRILVLDVTSGPTFPTLLDDPLPANSSQNGASKLSFSYDSRTLAVGLLGDDLAVLPEVLVYKKSGVPEPTWQLAAVRDLAGSVTDLEVSSDGCFLAVASKDRHLFEWAGHGRVEVFDLASDLRLEGIPHAGSVVQFRQASEPGHHAFLLSATALGGAPEPLGRVGTLHLMRPAIGSAIHMGVADDDGVTTLSYSVPDEPGLVGTTLYFQGLSASPRRLTQDYVSMTVLP